MASVVEGADAVGGGAGAARTGTTLDGNSITFSGIGLDISKPRKLSRLIFAALMLWWRGRVLPPLTGPSTLSELDSEAFGDTCGELPALPALNREAFIF